MAAPPAARSRGAKDLGARSEQTARAGRDLGAHSERAARAAKDLGARADQAARARAAKDLGARAEQAVVERMTRAGLTILGTNVRVGRYEIDVLARDERVIVVVEVRTRSAGSWTSGFGSIDPKKRDSIRRATGRLWQRRFKRDESVDRIRIDAASVTFENGEPVVEYVKAAF